jgi:hypothetical protein
VLDRIPVRLTSLEDRARGQDWALRSERPPGG